MPTLPSPACPSAPAADATEPATNPLAARGVPRLQAVSLEQRVQFGRLLRDRRTAARFSRTALAKHAQLSESTIKFIETARLAPSRTSLLRLLRVPELLLQWTELPAPYQAVPPPSPPRMGVEVPAARLNCYLAPHVDPVAMIAELGRVLSGTGGLVNPASLYVDPQSAADYLMLCRRSVAIAELRRTLPLGAIADCIVKECGPLGLEVLALGAGEAHLEVRLVQHLLDAQRTTPEVRLCLLDLSGPLLSVGLFHAQESLREGFGAHVWAVHGDFAQLPLYSHLFDASAEEAGRSASRRRVYLLLGNTLECLPHELRFFQHGLLARPGDLLVLDLCPAYGAPDDPERLHRRDPVLAAPLPAMDAAWLAGPLLRYGKDVARVEFSLALDPHGSVPGSYAIDAVATVQGRHRPPRRFVMRRYQRYDPARLAQSLSALGWDLLAMLPADGAIDPPAVAMVWVRRADSAAPRPRRPRRPSPEQEPAQAPGFSPPRADAGLPPRCANKPVVRK